MASAPEAPKTTSLFEARKENLKKQVLLESLHSVDYQVMVESGAGGQPSLEEQAEKAFAKMLREDDKIDTAGVFMNIKKDIEQSEVFQILSGMPKGALLHTHGISTGPFEAMVDQLRKDPRVFVYCGNGDGQLEYEIRYLSKKEAAESKDWVCATEFTHEELMSKIEMPVGIARGDLWPVFQNIWMRISELSDALPIWNGRKSFFWAMLTKLLATGVTYVEIKQLIPDGWVQPSEDGESVDRHVSIDVFMQIFKATVDEFKSENPTFLGAKVVWSTLKVFDEDRVKRDTETTLRLMTLYPGYIAGYDLVGHEDTLNPIAKYAHHLTSFRERGGRLLLHAGETCEPDADQIYDAIAVGSSRIGHAYALPKFPALMRMVREKGITVECCPISNQSLGYVVDLKNHPGQIMLNNGLRITISSDDAAIFRYADLTFDFALVAKAWGLTLTQLKHLSRQSFKCTALSHEEQHIAEQNFDRDWQAFLRDFVSSPSAKRASRRR